jgi:predicted Zn finger-like uncharacterized protein
MLIVCPNCATSYDVDVASLRPAGRRVRCVRCQTVWLAELSHADKILAAAEALGPVRRAVEAVAEAVAAAAPPNLPAEQLDAAANAEAERQVNAARSDAPAGEIAEAAEPADDAPLSESPEVESPPIAPADHDEDHSPTEADGDVAAEAEPLENVETFAARRGRPRSKRAGGIRWPLSRLQSVMLVLIVLDAVVVGWRADFVRFLPQTASFYAAIGLPVNLRGLNFDTLTTSTEQHENVPILVVEGSIVNDTRKMADMPHLRFAVRNAARQEIYSWTSVPPRNTLPPGEAVAFRTRLASPPPDAHDVLVRFLNRYDIMNGSR